MYPKHTQKKFLPPPESKEKFYLKYISLITKNENYLKKIVRAVSFLC